MSKTGFQLKEATDCRQLPYYLTLVVPTMFGWEYKAFLLLRKMLPQLREVHTGKVGAAIWSRADLGQLPAFSALGVIILWVLYPRIPTFRAERAYLPNQTRQ